MKLNFVDATIPVVFEKLEYDAAQMQDLMVQVARNELDGKFDKKEAEEAIRKTVFALLDLSPENMNKTKYYNRAWKRNHARLFEVIEDVIPSVMQQGWNSDPFFMNFVEMKNGNDGDRNEFWTEDETQLVVSKVSGGHHDLTVQRLGYGQSFTVAVSAYAVRIGSDFRAYLRGDVDWAKLITAVARAFDQKLKEMCYTEMIGIGSHLPAASMFNKTTTWAAAGAKDMLDQLIEDVNGANGNRGVIIMALESDLRKLGDLIPVNWISSEAKSDVYNTGRIGRYGSAEIMPIAQVLSKSGDTVTRLISENGHFYVMPKTMDKPIKVFNEGSPDIHQVTEDGVRLDDTIVYDYTQRFGVSAIVGTIFGHMRFTA